MKKTTITRLGFIGLALALFIGACDTGSDSDTDATGGTAGAVQTGGAGGVGGEAPGGQGGLGGVVNK